MGPGEHSWAGLQLCGLLVGRHPEVPFAKNPAMALVAAPNQPGDNRGFWFCMGGVRALGGFLERPVGT